MSKTKAVISKEESQALNTIRWCSALLIVLCHFFQGYGSIWAFAMNVGVQIFFVLSGFLYGNKTDVNLKSFYSGRLKKVYLPYVIWVTVSIFLLAIFSKDSLSIKGILFQYLCLKNLPGCGHLWFIQVIAVCYLILPFFLKCLNRNSISTVIIFYLLLSIATYIHYDSRFIWIGLYYIGFLMGRYRRMMIPIVIIAIVLSIFIFLDFSLDLLKSNSLENHILHCNIGLIIFIISLYLLSRYKICIYSGGGYELYLSHALFILGPLSLLFITPFQILNICITIFVIIGATYFLVKISKIIHNYISVEKIGYKSSKTV